MSETTDLVDKLDALADKYDEGDGGELVTTLRDAAIGVRLLRRMVGKDVAAIAAELDVWEGMYRQARDEADHLLNLRKKDAIHVLALHDAAGGNKGLSSADLIEYVRLAKRRLKVEVSADLMGAAYDAGFDASAEGWNGEYPGDAQDSLSYAEKKSGAIRAIIAGEGSNGY